jgi:hypothetical protein
MKPPKRRDLKKSLLKMSKIMLLYINYDSYFNANLVVFSRNSQGWTFLMKFIFEDSLGNSGGLHAN